jgi:hypothetical protein
MNLKFLLIFAYVSYFMNDVRKFESEMEVELRLDGIWNLYNILEI